MSIGKTALGTFTLLNLNHHTDSDKPGDAILCGYIRTFPRHDNVMLIESTDNSESLCMYRTFFFCYKNTTFYLNHHFLLLGTFTQVVIIICFHYTN